jgi:hypothetical protein
MLLQSFGFIMKDWFLLSPVIKPNVYFIITISQNNASYGNRSCKNRISYPRS